MILNSKVSTALLGILFVWVLFSVISIELEESVVKKEEESVRGKISDLEWDNELLGKYIDNLNNPEFLDKEARLRLNYKILGEEAVFVHRGPDYFKASSSDNFSEEYLPNYKKWWYYLLGY